MRDEWTALNTFWNSFSIPAYDSNTVPDDASFPYITYEASIGNLDNKVLLNARLWYRTTSWAGISQKAKEIISTVGGGYGIPYDDGRLWIVMASPAAQRMSEPDDPSVRTILLQIEAEYQTV